MQTKEKGNYYKSCHILYIHSKNGKEQTLDWTLHDSKFALHDCWLKCKSQLIFFLIEKNKKLHTYIVLSLNLVYAIYFSGHIILPSHCFMNIFLVAEPPTSVSASGHSHDSLFLIRTNTRLRIMRAHSSTISVGAKESVSMFSRTIFLPTQ